MVVQCSIVLGHNFSSFYVQYSFNESYICVMVLISKESFYDIYGIGDSKPTNFLHLILHIEETNA